MSGEYPEVRPDTKFKAGDRVVVTHDNPYWNGRKGVLQEMSGCNLKTYHPIWMIKFDVPFTHPQDTHGTFPRQLYRLNEGNFEFDYASDPEAVEAFLAES